MRSVLSGSPAVLSPNQAVDSAAIQAIAVGNGHNSRNHFIRAVELGMVKIALPMGFRSLLDYCMDTIKRGEHDPQNEFIFSSLPFLYRKENDEYVYDYAFRKTVLDYIFTALSETRRKYSTGVMPSGLSPEEQATIERYISVMQQLDRAVQYYEDYYSKKELLPKLLEAELVKRLMNEPPDTAMAEFLPLIIQTCNKPDSSVYRSFYYRFCDLHMASFGLDVMMEVKEIINICYNKVLALSLKEQAEIAISPDYAQTASLQASGEDADYSLVSSSREDHDALEKLDWETLVEIYEAISSICREKGLSWQEAIREYHKQQSRLPFMLGGKYVLITSLTMAASAIPLVGTLTGSAVSDFMWNAICDAGSDLAKKPSVTDIVEMTKQAKKNTDIMNIVVCTKK